MIGLLPASGRAERLNGIPKFALPTMSGETLIGRHVRLMSEVCEQIRVCTTPRWAGLIKELVPMVDLRIIEPSTMNDAIQRMVDVDTDYLIGMPDTFFTGPSPYGFLAEVTTDLGVACWQCPPDLRGRVGQVHLVNGRIAGMRDKDPACEFSHMWGALKFNRIAVRELNVLTAHPGVDLPRLLGLFEHTVVTVGGHYIDCGTPTGIRDMLTEGVP